MTFMQLKRYAQARGINAAFPSTRSALGRHEKSSTYNQFIFAAQAKLALRLNMGVFPLKCSEPKAAASEGAPCGN